MNIEQLKSAREAVIEAKNEWIGQKQLCIYVGMSEIETLNTLLDQAINGSSSQQYQLVASNSDLDSLKREIKTPYNLAQMQRFDDAENAVDWLIEYLAPRIVREGFTMMPNEPTPEILMIMLHKDIAFNRYKAMIAASSGIK